MLLFSRVSFLKSFVLKTILFESVSDEWLFHNEFFLMRTEEDVLSQIPMKKINFLLKRNKKFFDPDEWIMVSRRRIRFRIFRLFQ